MATKCHGAVEERIYSAVQPGLDFKQEGASPAIGAAPFLLSCMKGVIPGCCLNGSDVASGIGSGHTGQRG